MLATEQSGNLTMNQTKGLAHNQTEVHDVYRCLQVYRLEYTNMVLCTVFESYST